MSQSQEVLKLKDLGDSRPGCWVRHPLTARSKLTCHIRIHKVLCIRNTYSTSTSTTCVQSWTGLLAWGAVDHALTGAATGGPFAVQGQGTGSGLVNLTQSWPPCMSLWPAQRPVSCFIITWHNRLAGHYSYHRPLRPLPERPSSSLLSLASC